MTTEMKIKYMSNKIKILFKSNYCCRKSDAELYTVKMFSPLPQEPQDEYDEEGELIEKSPVVYSDDQKKTLELFKILEDFESCDRHFSVEEIKHLIVSYEVAKANEDNDERRIGCDFYLRYRAC